MKGQKLKFKDSNNNMNNTIHKIKTNNHVQIMLLRLLMKVPPLKKYI